MRCVATYYEYWSRCGPPTLNKSTVSGCTVRSRKHLQLSGMYSSYYEALRVQVENPKDSFLWVDEAYNLRPGTLHPYRHKFCDVGSWIAGERAIRRKKLEKTYW